MLLRKTKWFWTSGLTIIVLVMCALLTILIVNDYTAKQVEKDLRELPLPEKTGFVESISKAGKLTGNGNAVFWSNFD